MSAIPAEASALRNRFPDYAADDYVETYFDPTFGVFWCYLKPEAPKSFSPELISSLRRVQHEVQSRAKVDSGAGLNDRVHYQVFASNIPGVFSLGGDLKLLARLIRSRNQAALMKYARDCIELVYWTSVSYGLPLTTVSLVRGRAMGGGFEAALAANVVVAEKGSTLGFPEVLFNLFPGMGAYSLLVERVAPKQAEKLILSGRLYTAEELFELGLVDVLADEGEGEVAITRYIRQHHKKASALYAFRRAIDKVRSFALEDLLGVAQIWVDAALSLGPKELAVMERISHAQYPTDRTALASYEV